MEDYRTEVERVEAVESYGEGVPWSPTGPVLPWSVVAEIEARAARGLLPQVSCVLLVSPAQADVARRAGTRPIGSVVRLAHARAAPEALDQ